MNRRIRGRGGSGVPVRGIGFLEPSERAERAAGARDLVRIAARVRQHGDAIENRRELAAEHLHQETELQRRLAGREPRNDRTQRGFGVGVPSARDRRARAKRHDVGIARIQFFGERVDLRVASFDERAGRGLERRRRAARRLRGPGARQRQEHESANQEGQARQIHDRSYYRLQVRCRRFRRLARGPGRFPEHPLLDSDALPQQHAEDRRRDRSAYKRAGHQRGAHELAHDTDVIGVRDEAVGSARDKRRAGNDDDVERPGRTERRNRPPFQCFCGSEQCRASEQYGKGRSVAQSPFAEHGQKRPGIGDSHHLIYIVRRLHAAAGPLGPLVGCGTAGLEQHGQKNDDGEGGYMRRSASLSGERNGIAIAGAEDDGLQDRGGEAGADGGGADGTGRRDQRAQRAVEALLS